MLLNTNTVSNDSQSDDFLANLDVDTLICMEAAGQDVNKLRKDLSRDPNKIERAGKTDLSRLEPFSSTPRSTKTSFFRQHIGHLPIFRRKSYKDKFANAKIVYPVVVKAPTELYKPITDIGVFAVITVIHHLNNEALASTISLQKAASILADMCSGNLPTPPILTKVIDSLNNPLNFQHFQIAGEVLGEEFKNMKFLVDNIHVRQEELPGTRIPNNHILPMLDIHERGRHSFYKLIRGHWYEAK